MDDSEEMLIQCPSELMIGCSRSFGSFARSLKNGLIGKQFSNDLKIRESSFFFSANSLEVIPNVRNSSGMETAMKHKIVRFTLNS